MHFNKCLQMFTCPRHILIVTAPNWPSIVDYDESGMAGRGGAGRAWPQLVLLVDSGHPGLCHCSAWEPVPHSRHMLAGTSISQSTSKQPLAHQCLTWARWKVGRPHFALTMATMCYYYYHRSDTVPRSSEASSLTNSE